MFIFSTGRVVPPFYGIKVKDIVVSGHAMKTYRSEVTAALKFLYFPFHALQFDFLTLAYKCTEMVTVSQ
jgi:hypothetical protein